MNSRTKDEEVHNAKREIKHKMEPITGIMARLISKEFLPRGGGGGVRHLSNSSMAAKIGEKARENHGKKVNRRWILTVNLRRDDRLWNVYLKLFYIINRKEGRSKVNLDRPNGNECRRRS